MRDASDRHTHNDKPPLGKHSKSSEHHLPSNAQVQFCQKKISFSYLVHYTLLSTKHMYKIQQKYKHFLLTHYI